MVVYMALAEQLSTLSALQIIGLTVFCNYFVSVWRNMVCHPECEVTMVLRMLMLPDTWSPTGVQIEEASSLDGVSITSGLNDYGQKLI